MRASDDDYCIAVLKGTDRKASGFVVAELSARGVCSARLARVLLEEVLRDGEIDRNVFRAAWECRKDIDSLLCQLLLELASDDGRCRTEAARLMDRRAMIVHDKGTEASAALEGLFHAAEDTEEAVRVWVCSALKQYTEFPGECVPVLVRLMSDPSAGVREKAAFGIGQFGSAAMKAIESLGMAMHDSEAGVRFHAIRSVCRICEHSPDALSGIHAKLAQVQSSYVKGSKPNDAQFEVAPGSIRWEFVRLLKDEDDDCVAAALDGLRSALNLTEAERCEIACLREHGSPKVRLAARMLYSETAP